MLGLIVKCDHYSMYCSISFTLPVDPSYFNQNKHGSTGRVKEINNIKSDLMYSLIITLASVCVIEARGQTQFLYLKHSGCLPN